MKKITNYFIFAAVFISCISNFCWPDKVEIKGRQILVNGKPFTAKGVAFGSTPVGKSWYFRTNPSSYDWSKDPPLYNTDFPLIKAMGGNTIRIYDPPTETAALDAAYNNGIYVIMNWKVDHADFSVATSTGIANRKKVIADFENMVNTWKNHPAILMWCLGNEHNYNYNEGSYGSGTDKSFGVDVKEWYSLVDECALAAHNAELDTGTDFHPVTTANGEVFNIGSALKLADDANMPNLDVWSVQVYRGRSFYNLFSDYAGKSQKPLCITEYGCDSWDAVQNYENQGAQAETFWELWNEIENNLSSLNSEKVCIGGTLHMWADDWNRNQGGTANTVHDTTPVGHANNLYDSDAPQNWNDEWTGIVSISPNTYEKTPKKAYYTLRNLWTGYGSIKREVVPLFISKVKNYPNPFSPYLGETRIEFTLSGMVKIEVEIYDIAGRPVKSWHGSSLQNGGFYRTYWNGWYDEVSYQMYWDGKDRKNDIVANGVYICRITAENESLSEVAYRRIMVIK